MPIRAAVSRLRRRCVRLQPQDLSPAEYDMKAVNDRVYAAMKKMGKTRVDVAMLYGMDVNLPLAMQPAGKVPRPTLENVSRLADFLGVSVRWILHGEAENSVDIFVAGAGSPTATGSLDLSAASNGAAIINGAQHSTVVVQHINGDDLTEMERAIVTSLRNIPPRDRAAAMSYIFALEQEAQDEKEKKAPSA